MGGWEPAVVAMDKKRHFDSYNIYLLDEYESFDTRKLVRQIGVMDLKYGIIRNKKCISDSLDRWIGDNKNEAAERFIKKMNNQNKNTHHKITLRQTMLLEMKNVYSYILPQIKELLNTDRRLLFLKNSKILDYLSEVEEIDISDFKLGEYPAIEVLGFTIIEMWNKVKDVKDSLMMPKGKSKYDYDPLNAEIGRAHV